METGVQWLKQEHLIFFIGNWVIMILKILMFCLSSQWVDWEQKKMDNQEIIKIDLEDRITKQSRPFNVFITAIHEHQFSNFFRWWTQDQTCNFLTSTPKKWRPKSNGYDWKWNMCLLLPYTRIWTSQTFSPWQVSWSHLPSYAFAW